MKTTYAFLLSGAMLMGISLTSCSGENTTGVETGTTANEANGGMNGGGGTEGSGGAETGMNGANNSNAAGNTLQGNSDETTGADTARTTTPSTDLQ